MLPSGSLRESFPKGAVNYPLLVAIVIIQPPLRSGHLKRGDCQICVAWAANKTCDMIFPFKRFLQIDLILGNSENKLLIMFRK